uniref:Reverse transcriptase domain-containing protein n=1 Tax=Tanacetum cinerariifolium TaxID=118510 RepID=A0A6L2JY24_TANCI|nr:hypothetical protein [Tanacetum cinerariifolium]
MTSFDYRLNPLYPIKECSSCGALYTTDYCCSEGSLKDKIIFDLHKTPDLSQRSPQNCPKCGHPVDGHYCQGRALLCKKFNEDLFTSCVNNGILQDSSEPSDDDTNIANALREPFVVNQDPGKNSSQSPPQINHHCCYGGGDPLGGIFCHQCTCELCGNDAHYGYNCPSKVPIIPDPEPFNNQTIKELPPTVQSFDPKSDLVHDSPNIPACYDDDDDDYTIAITPNEPDKSLSMGDEHLDTISATKSDEFIKSSVENLVPNPSESEGEHECDVPACEVFTTFLNILFDSNYDFYSSDDQSFSNEDVPNKIFSNPLFDEEIISMKIDPHQFNAESDLIESLLNHDSSIISSSSKINSLFDEFVETHFIKRLLYDNSSPRPLEVFVFENSDVTIESFSQSHIPVEDIDSLMEEIDLSFTPDYPMPPGIEEDDYDAERDILILEEFLSNNSLSLLENEAFHFDIPSSFRPPAKPPDGNTCILNVKMMGDISEQKVPMLRLMITLVPKQEKSPNLLSYLGLEAF